MTAGAGSKRSKGGGNKKSASRPLKERLMAQGVYKEQESSTSEVPTTASHLFSPVRATKKPARGSESSKSDATKSSKAVMQSYFKRKSVDSERTSTSQAKSNLKDANVLDSFSFMLDQAEMEKVKETSQAFITRLTEDDTECSDVIIMDTSSLDQMAENKPVITEGNVTTIPLLYNSRGVAYSMMKLGPKSQFGPLINTGGVMVLVFIDVPTGKIFYESLNLNGKRRLPCQRQSHVLLLPDDVFKIYNESDSTHACVLMISCRKDGKDFNLEQHVQGAYHTPGRA